MNKTLSKTIIPHSHFTQLSSLLTLVMYSASRLRSGATSPVTTASQSEKAVGLRVRDLRLE